MDHITNHLGPQSLPPTLVSNIDSSVSQAKGRSYLKKILDSGKMQRKITQFYCSAAASLNVEEESTHYQKWQFPFQVHQNHLESRLKTLLSKVGVTSVNGYAPNYKPFDGHIDNIENRQLNSSSLVRLPSRLASPWTNEDFCLSDGRFRFLLDDPVLLQKLMFQENLQASSDAINLEKNYSNGEHPAVQLVALSRLCRLYQSVFEPISIRLSYSDTDPVILVMNSSDAHQFTCTSTEITEFRKSSIDCIEIPFIISELLGNSDQAFSCPHYILLLFNENYDCWELVGCVNSFHFVSTTLETPFEHPSDVLLVSYENEDNLAVSYRDHDHIVDDDALPGKAEADLQFLDESTPAAMLQHFYENSEETDNMLLQDRLEHQIFSCPTFIFPSLIDMMSAPINIDEDEPTPKEKEPEIAQVKNVDIFKCETCEKEYCKKSSLKAHQVLHNPAKWKHCSYCDFKSPRYRTMKTHVAKFHRQASEINNAG